MSQPTKKLKTTETKDLNKKMLKVSINIRLMKSQEKVKRIIKFLNINEKDRKKAEYLVEVENGKELKVVNNDEMIHFYKDVLIDYYQNIHFS